ncbi:hypothetical protein AVEN_151805-1 [Araneus ventricosus]|uniref:Uncharacterized protein n=1 Tax=Araneus ventricosus TaxID=182803 RepID=A0A4Y2TKU2_ARAVE|nr:hypothetical protein AVEN_151805-1 [Araneus ventricosus]
MGRKQGRKRKAEEADKVIEKKEKKKGKEMKQNSRGEDITRLKVFLQRCHRRITGRSKMAVRDAHSGAIYVILCTEKAETLYPFWMCCSQAGRDRVNSPSFSLKTRYGMRKAIASITNRRERQSAHFFSLA